MGEKAERGVRTAPLGEAKDGLVDEAETRARGNPRPRTRPIGQPDGHRQRRSRSGVKNLRRMNLIDDQHPASSCRAPTPVPTSLSAADKNARRRTSHRVASQLSLPGTSARKPLTKTTESIRLSARARILHHDPQRLLAGETVETFAPVPTLEQVRGLCQVSAAERRARQAVFFHPAIAVRSQLGQGRTRPMRSLRRRRRGRRGG